MDNNSMNEYAGNIPTPNVHDMADKMRQWKRVCSLRFSKLNKLLLWPRLPKETLN